MKDRFNVLFNLIVGYQGVTYHQPAAEQQSPKDEPLQVKPEVPPQVASVETLEEPVGDVALLEVEEEEGTVGEEDPEGTEEESLVETVEIELTLPVVEEQVPKADWHPAPQYASVEPLRN